MKRILILSVLVLVVGIGAVMVAFRSPAAFGQPFKVAAMTGLPEVVKNPTSHLVADVRTEGRIVRQCPSSGCWFFLEDGSGSQVRVELGHLGMKFPQHVGGMVEVEGRLTQNGKQLEIVGNSVRFK